MKPPTPSSTALKALVFDLSVLFRSNKFLEKKKLHLSLSLACQQEEEVSHKMDSQSDTMSYPLGELKDHL
jgi:hypothetical protein